MMEIGEKFYELVADPYSGLNIIEVTDTSNPVKISSLPTKYAMGVSTMKIEGKHMLWSRMMMQD